MTDYEFFIEQDIKTIRKKFKEFGINDYRFIPNKQIEFNKKLSLTNDNKHKFIFTTLGGYYGRSGELVILLEFLEDLGFGNIKIKNSTIKFYISGTSYLKIRKELSNDLVIKNDKCNFFHSISGSNRKLIFNNYSIFQEFGKDFSSFKTIKDFFDKVRNYSKERHHIINDLEKSLEDGRFINAYNSINQIEFREGNERFFRDVCWQRLINYYFKFSSLGKNVNLEKIIFLTIILHNDRRGISNEDLKNLESTNPETVWISLEKLYEKHHKDGHIKETRKFLEQIRLEFQIGILELRRDISGKYDIDPSWILGQNDIFPNYLPKKEELGKISKYSSKEFDFYKENIPLEETRKGIDEEIERLKKLKEGS